MTTVHEFKATALDGTERALADWRGKVLLIVNTASRCGLTPQYTGLEALQRKYAARGFEVLGFPCNQFGAQEPGSAEEIRSFCSTKYDISFPLFAKVDVNGDGAPPLWKHLKEQKPGLLGIEAIKWNFTKFLVGKDGKPVQRFESGVSPDSPELAAAIEKALR